MRLLATLCALLIATLGCTEQMAPAEPMADADAGPTGTDSGLDGLPSEVLAMLETLTATDLDTPPNDMSNDWADDPSAAALGQMFFFDTRFSGPLLSSDNDGSPGTLGKQGEPGKVACASCHVPDSAFTDTRTSRRQISLGADWTPRKAPSLVNAAHSQLFMWDGRRDAGFNQVFGPLERAAELNSSRLFAAQQIERFYKNEYEAVFGPMPDISAFETLPPEDAGCTEALDDPLSDPEYGCAKPYDDKVTRIVVNFGKAINAYLRQLSCGETPFDRWVAGDDEAVGESAKRGASLFVGKAGCVSCHSGTMMTDNRFHNVGVAGATVAFVFEIGADDGAAKGIPHALDDELNVRGAFSDGDDGRLDAYDGMNDEDLLGAFKTPSLRCVAERPSYMHNAKYLSLEEVVSFFNEGGATGGFVGRSTILPLGLEKSERDDLIAFLKSLSGPGPAMDLRTPPQLPN